MLSTAVLTGFDGPMGHGGGGGAIWLLVLFPLVGILVLGLLFAVLGRRGRRGWAGGPGGPGYSEMHAGWQGASGTRSAERTLAERFAQGDIDEVEYRARLEVLRANRPEAPTPPQ
jgi:putative membrane protein